MYYLPFSLFFSIFQVLYCFKGGGAQLVGNLKIDVSSKSVNKERALDTCNWFAFIVSHLAVNNRILQCLIENEFSTGKKVCGSTNVLKINLGLPFRANSYSVLFFFIHRKVYQKITNEQMSLPLKFLSALV